MARTDIHRLADLGLDQALRDLEEILSRVDARVILPTYAIYRMLGVGNESVGTHARPAPVAVELAASLLLPHFGKTDKFDSAGIQEGIDAIEAYQTAYVRAGMLDPGDGAPNENFDSLRVHLRLHSELVRGTAYPTQVSRRIDELLAPLDSKLADLAKITPSKAAAIAKGILSHSEANINRIRERITELVEAGIRTVAEDPEQHDQISVGLQQAIATMGYTWVPMFDEVANRVEGLSRREWEVFRDLFGLTAEVLPSVERLVDLQDRPIVFLEPDRAFGANGVTILDAIFNHFDSLARSVVPLRDEYGRICSEWMEMTIGSFLGRLFPAECMIVNACYPDPDRAGGEAEADIVVLWGPFLVVAEAKARKVDQEAFRGGEHKLKNTLSKNIGDAFAQAQRLIRALEKEGQLELREKYGTRVLRVNRQQLRRIMPISVTLQHLSGIPTQLAITQRLGLFKGGAYPWSVCIDDLDVITRFVGSPDVFLHYIDRRIDHQKLEISIRGDELDIFGQYLDNRLHPDYYENRKEIRNGKGPTAIGFHGGEERFEPTYLAEWYGEDAPSESVELSVPEEIRNVLNELRSRTDNGARWIAFALLGQRDGSLMKMASALTKLRGQQLAGERIFRITHEENGSVFNILVHGGLSKSEFFKQVTMRTRLEHYRFKAKSTVSIGLRAGSHQAFEVAQWQEGDWEHEDDMERFLAKDRDAPRRLIPFANFKKPGRNDPCPCRSGRKFKKCCIDRIRFEND